MTPRTALGAAFAALIAALLTGCPPGRTDPDATPDAAPDAAPDASSEAAVDGAMRFTPPTCPAAEQAPLVSCDGGTTCTPVGADAAAATAPWPDTTGAATPIAYVRAGAADGGVGTMDQPYGDLSSALAASPATVAIAPGTLALTAPVVLAHDVALIGSGTAAASAGTTLVATPGLAAVTVAGATVSLARLAIRYPGGAMPSGAGGGVEATAGAHVSLDNVSIENAWEGVRVDAATLAAHDVSVLRAGGRGVFLRNGADGTIARLLVRDGAGVGVLAQDARLALDTALIASNGRDGLVLFGGMAGAGHTVVRVASIGNGVTAMSVAGSAAGSSALVHGSRLVLADTRVPAGTTGGDGLYVGPGGDARLDEDLVGDAQRGCGSTVVGNARAGVLASGDPDAGAASALTVSAALIGSNASAGVFVQNGAAAGSIAYSRVEDNAGLGVGVTSRGSIAALQCNLVRGTRASMLATSVGVLMVADGLSIADNGRPVAVTQSEFSLNARFGAVFDGASAVLRNNTGNDNEYGLGAYASTVDDDGSNRVTGRMATPPSASPGVASGGP